MSETALIIYQDPIQILRVLDTVGPACLKLPPLRFWTSELKSGLIWLEAGFYWIQTFFVL